MLGSCTTAVTRLNYVRQNSILLFPDSGLYRSHRKLTARCTTGVPEDIRYIGFHCRFCEPSFPRNVFIRQCFKHQTENWSQMGGKGLHCCNKICVFFAVFLSMCIRCSIEKRLWKQAALTIIKIVGKSAIKGGLAGLAASLAASAAWCLTPWAK